MTKLTVNKVGLVYIRTGCVVCPTPHYDLYEIDGNDKYCLACLVAPSYVIKLIKKLIKEHNNAVEKRKK